jgi:two-component system LytT family response regulator
MSEPVRVLIVDDEQLAREGVRGLLEGDPTFAVVDECGSGQEALGSLEAHQVDVVLLDIQMPGMTGFELLQHIPEERMPVVVFLTAFDQHALRAFEAHALDYVVKPFSDARLLQSLARARRQVYQRRLGKATTDLASLLAALNASGGDGRPSLVPSPPAARHLARIPVRSIGKVTYVRVEDVVWIGAADYYAEVHCLDGRTHLVRETMQSLEGRLDPAHFIRSHRSTIVNLDHVLELRTDDAEKQGVVLRNGTRLPLGRGRREAIEQALGNR